MSPKTPDGPRRQSDVVDVVMEFSRCEAPEGMHRLIEQYAAMVQPYKPSSEDEDVPHTPKQDPLQSEALGAEQPTKDRKRPLNIIKMNTHATGELKKNDDKVKKDD